MAESVSSESARQGALVAAALEQQAQVMQSHMLALHEQQAWWGEQALKAQSEALAETLSSAQAASRAAAAAATAATASTSSPLRSSSGGHHHPPGGSAGKGRARIMTIPIFTQAPPVKRIAPTGGIGREWGEEEEEDDSSGSEEESSSDRESERGLEREEAFLVSKTRKLSAGGRKKGAPLVVPITISPAAVFVSSPDTNRAHSPLATETQGEGSEEDGESERGGGEESAVALAGVIQGMWRDVVGLLEVKKDGGSKGGGVVSDGGSSSKEGEGDSQTGGGVGDDLLLALIAAAALKGWRGGGGGAATGGGTPLQYQPFRPRPPTLGGCGVQWRV